MRKVFERGGSPTWSPGWSGILALLLCCGCASTPATRTSIAAEPEPAAVTATIPLDAAGAIRAIGELHLAPSAQVGVFGAASDVYATSLARHCSSGIVYVAETRTRRLEELSLTLDREGIENVVPMFASPVDPHFPPGRLDLVLLEGDLDGIGDPVSYLRRLGRSLKLDGKLAVFEIHGLADTLERAGFARVGGSGAELELWRPRNQW